jgi:riboflavin synthase
MFTGIVQDVGEIAAIEKRGDWTVSIKARKLSTSKFSVGASICCGGICLTVIERGFDRFKVQLSPETLSKTTAMKWDVGTQINLEPSLRAGDELGGHMLSGHVDGVAYVVGKQQDGDSVRYRFEAPPEFARFIAPKGAVGLDGISLTVNEVMGREFGVNIIPHTQKATTFGEMEVGAAVNFEVDMIMRYLERLVSNKA